MRHVLAFAVAFGLAVQAWPQDPPRPVEPPKPSEAPKKDQEPKKEQDKAGEELLKKIEDKAIAAKTLKYKGKMTMEAGGQAMEFEAEGKIKGDKLKLSVGGEMMGQAIEISVLSDGAKLNIEATGPMGRGNDDGELEAPKNLGEGVRTSLVRMGVIVTMFFSDKKARDKDVDLKKMITARDAKLGKEEKVGDKACKVVHYTLVIDEEKDEAEATLWVDAETLAPVKHEINVKGQSFTETYSEWKLDEEIKDEVFTVKKDEKKEEPKKEEKK